MTLKILRLSNLDSPHVVCIWQEVWQQPHNTYKHRSKEVIGKFLLVFVGIFAVRDILKLISQVINCMSIAQKV